MLPAFSSFGDSVAVSASVASAAAVLPGAAVAPFYRPEVVRVYNGTAGVAFFRTGPTAPTAVATDTFVAPGATEVFSLGPDSAQVAVILSSGTGNVHFQRGGGI